MAPWVQIPIDPPRLNNFMRFSYNGIITAFQAEDTGSIPVDRSIIKDYIMKVNITYGKKPKTVVEIIPDDVWNMDVTLAHVIHPMLLKYQECNHGSFNVDDEDVPEGIRLIDAGSKECEYELDEFHEARHDYVINEMIWAFANILDDKSHDFWIEKPLGLPEESDRFFATGKYDLEACLIYEARIQNGTKLFGKYYQSLWT